MWQAPLPTFREAVPQAISHGLFMKSLDSAPQAAAFNAERSDRTNNTSRSSGKNNRGDGEKSVRHYRGNWNFHHNKNNN